MDELTDHKTMKSALMRVRWYQGNIAEIADAVRDIVERSGFSEASRAEDPQQKELLILRALLLTHCEISEAVEHLRERGSAVDDPEFIEELADVVIRVLNIAGIIGSKAFAAALIDKIEKNASRPFKHGKKF